MVPNIEHIRRVSGQVRQLLVDMDFTACSDGRRAVFFDVDGTLCRDDSLEMLINATRQKGLLKEGSRQLKTYDLARDAWKNRDMAFDDYIKLAIAEIRNLRGIPRRTLEETVDEIMLESGRYYLFTWLLLLRLKTMGYKLIAISGAPDFMLPKFLKKAGVFVDEIHGTKYFFEDDKFTGEIDFSVIADKGEFIRSTYGEKFDLEKCLVLGDTVNDSKMFEMVGRGVAINPTYEFAEIAQEKKWPIAVERKNLVLVFPDGNFKSVL